MANTFEQIWTQVYTNWGENQTSTVPLYNLTTSVKPLINEVQFMVCNGLVVDETVNPKATIEAGDLRFLYKEKYIQNVQPQKLTSAATIGGSTLAFTSTGYEDSGYICVNGNVISYTGNTGTGITGCTGIEIAHPASSVVYQVRPVETDSDVSMDLWYLNTGIKVEYFDFRDQPDLEFYFSLISDNLTDSERRYVKIAGYNSAQDQFKLTYYKKATDMVDDDDECMLPDDWGKLVIAPIVAGKILMRDGVDVQKGISLLREGYGNLQNFYQKHARIRKKHNQQFKTRAMSNYYGNDYNTPEIYHRAS